jgi:selenocysteine lyase/cysteine desulfurase
MRAAFARLLSAGSDEIALTTSVSQAVAGVVSALRFAGSGRPRIVISDHEFPTVGQIAHAQELRGAEVVHVRPAADGTIPPERFAELIDERTALVCCTSVSYRTGHRHDIATIARIAHDHGALCLADSYQAAGALALDAGALGVDFITGGTVKYLLGSAGLGFLYVRRGLLGQLLPTQTGWFADEDIFAMDLDDYSPAPDARRFDAGTPPVPNIYAGIAGISLIEQAGTTAIEAHLAALAGELIEGLEELGAQVVTPRQPDHRGPLVCVRSIDAEGLVAALGAAGIAASSRDRNLRLALHLYNTHDDLEVVLAALHRHRHLLASE